MDNENRFNRSGECDDVLYTVSLGLHTAQKACISCYIYHQIPSVYIDNPAGSHHPILVFIPTIWIHMGLSHQ